ncbi:TPA: hypothetical protein ACGY8I_004383 [Aeromonas hydrophila]|uniref:hypothetical protein n=1 Tax=Aeromonas TaxID=642 RepID=UPI001FF62BC7|nr:MULTISPECIES: hypothetical protein [Aeromonas]MCK0188050.1 hypothetical protein [Aeromonas hydrophila]UOV94396.1 hypothetical protein MUW98_23735 [Aeromonas hydrophila]
MIQISPSLINSLESIGRSSKLSEAETQDVLDAARTLHFLREVLTTIAVGYDVGDATRDELLRWTGRLPGHELEHTGEALPDMEPPVLQVANVPWEDLHIRLRDGLNRLAREQQLYFQMMLGQRDSAGLWSALRDEGLLTEQQLSLLQVQQPTPDWILSIAQDVVERMGIL